MNMSLNINELFKGVAVIIDDEVDDETANIKQIIEQISSLHIPMLKFTSIPSNDDISHFQHLSFVLLDWKLIPFIEDAYSPDGLEDENDQSNFEFIKRLQKICYCPIFIFTNEDKDNIKDKLVLDKLYTVDKPSNILIESKSAFRNSNSLQLALSKWIKTNPSIYVLKKWEREYQKSKNNLFFEFQHMSPVWPKVMWRCFSEDGGNESLELGDLISRNLHTRMKPFKFNKNILKSTAKQKKGEIRKVLEGARFLRKLHKDDISTGDVFCEEYQDREITKQRYWLNIRAQCDTIRGSKIDKTEIYCLKGRIINNKSICSEHHNLDSEQKVYRFGDGQFYEQINNVIVPFINNGKIIEFLFNDLYFKKWGEIKTMRIGRLLPPYITRIQQRYALYLHRQGLPRIPDEAIF